MAKISYPLFALFTTLTLNMIAIHGKPLPRDATALQGETMRVKRSDDFTLADVRALVQQQAEEIQTLRSQQEATDNRVHAIESKLPASFAPVAFTVRFSHDNGNDGIPLNPGETLQFDAVVTNAGNGYNPQTGIFTAPVAGVYSFFLSQMGTNAHGADQLEIVKNGAVLDRVWTEGAGDIGDQGSSQVTTHLAAGEQVWVRQQLGDGVRGAWYTIFSGFLVQAD